MSSSGISHSQSCPRLAVERVSPNTIYLLNGSTPILAIMNMVASGYTDLKAVVGAYMMTIGTYHFKRVRLSRTSSNDH